ncbi:hypothetical protein P378_17880 [Desulforamulus profundi]|uniref:DNA polymerase III delta N-terminal domain-containing protein n=1 Tax=Desulforamulus profundi TaxID=1383067 RepID=A0A2C6MCX9_9FIRM|nr:hypothetical protein [Desulforamulus profundi]PHJ37173.1 hypothetical protein P378_17880 [Desulforamulus profundi]
MEYYKGLMNSLARGQVSPVYLFYGEEEYLKEKIVEKFKEVLLPQAADFNLDVVDGEETEPFTVVSLAENLPLWRNGDWLLSKIPPGFRQRVKPGTAGSGQKRIIKQGEKKHPCWIT